MKKIVSLTIAMFIFLSFVLPFSALAAAPQTPSIPYAVYISPEGVRFVSYSKQWDRQKLLELYDIFRRLPKGEEVKYLSRIILLEGGPEGTSGHWNGSYLQIKGSLKMAKGRYINLYHVEKRDDVVDVGLTLAHEYGHHFTSYWLAKAEGKFTDDPTTGWAKIRNLDGLPISFAREGTYTVEYFWDPDEILADDYISLFAPPELKEWAIKTADNYDGRPYNLTSFVRNQYIPSAESVPGLRAYWARLTGLELDATALKAPEAVLLKAKTITDWYGFSKIAYEVVTDQPLSKNYQYAVLITDRRQPYGTYTLGFSRVQDGSAGALLYDDFPPEGKQNVRIYVYDPETNRISYSREVWFDFSDPMNPKKIENQTKF